MALTTPRIASVPLLITLLLAGAASDVAVLGDDETNACGQRRKKVHVEAGDLDAEEGAGSAERDDDKPGQAGLPVAHDEVHSWFSDDARKRDAVARRITDAEKAEGWRRAAASGCRRQPATARCR